MCIVFSIIPTFARCVALCKKRARTRVILGRFVYQRDTVLTNDDVYECLSLRERTLI